eukprot:1773538-Rhodomonas_salina.1
MGQPSQDRNQGLVEKELHGGYGTFALAWEFLSQSLRCRNLEVLSRGLLNRLDALQKVLFGGFLEP